MIFSTIGKTYAKTIFVYINKYIRRTDMNRTFIPQIFRCKRDNLTIKGNVYGADENIRKPAVIICHGFLSNRKSVRKYAKLLADAGFVAFTFDFCGGGIMCESEGKTENMTVFTELADLEAVVEFVLSQSYVSGSRVALMGCSQGGFVSAIYAARHPEKVERLALFYPAFSIPDDARDGKMIFYKFDPDNIPELLGKNPMKLGGEYAGSVIDKDFEELIEGYDGPILLVHGEKDAVVDCVYSLEAEKIYRHANAVLIENGAHGFEGNDDIKAMLALRKFMDVCQDKKYENLLWDTNNSELLLHTPVFDIVNESKSSRTGVDGDYVAIEAPNWVVVVAVHDDNFVLVRQWRHGEERVTLEFPGGVCEDSENPKDTALRELKEETGFEASKITRLCTVSANPALFRNHFSVFLAEDLIQTKERQLDEDEILDFEEMPIDEVIAKYGDGELTHAYMGTAIACYLRHLKEVDGDIVEKSGE